MPRVTYTEQQGTIQFSKILPLFREKKTPFKRRIRSYLYPVAWGAVSAHGSTQGGEAILRPNAIPAEIEFCLFLLSFFPLKERRKIAASTAFPLSPPSPYE